MDKEKVKAIQEWPTPQTVSELRSFLGLANYYRRFVEGYYRRVKLLTDLLKKGCEWVWSKYCQEAFDNLKKVISSEPVLTLPDLEKPLEVETDASDYAIGGTDNTAVSHFLTQPKLTVKQARWQEFLAEFDFIFEHKAGKKNQGPRMFVPRAGNLRQKLLKECHDTHGPGIPVGGVLLLCWDKGRSTKDCRVTRATTHARPTLGEYLLGFYITLASSRRYWINFGGSGQVSNQDFLILWMRPLKVDALVPQILWGSGSRIWRLPRLTWRKQRSRDRRLVRKYEGPVSIVAKVGNASYKVDPPTWMRVHPVFHVSNLKSFHTDPNIDNQRRIVKVGGKQRREYLVKWGGFDQEENTWEREYDLRAFKQKIKEFHAMQGWTAGRVWADPQIYEIKADLVGKRPFRVSHGLATEPTRLSTRVNQKDKLESTSFHIAAANGNAQALQVLLLEDPDGINYKTIMKETPLFFAVKNDHIECADLLQRWGANSEVLNLRRERPIDLAKSQDMRFILNKTYITLKHRNSPIQQKYTCFQGDGVFFYTCETLLTMEDEGNYTERTNINLKTEICKYFESGGCVRGSKCFYAHDSLSKIFQDEFGPVEDAHVVSIKTGDELLSRGFGFVIFKHENSVLKAVQEHYVTIMDKQVEIKSAVGRWDESLKLSLQQHQKDPNDQYQPPLESSTGKTTEEMPRRKAFPIASNQKIPAWLRMFKKWLPSFLQEVSKKPKEDEYPLSSLKADFRAAFGLELDHVSLGYTKLSDFMRSFPDLCCMKVKPVGGGESPNHMVLIPSSSRSDCKSLQSLTMRCCSPSCAAAPQENTDIDSKKPNYLQDLFSNSCEDVSLSSSQIDHSKSGLQGNSILKNKLPVAHPKFMQVLKSDFCLPQMKLYAERKIQTENANDEKGGTNGRVSTERKLGHTRRHNLEAYISCHLVAII
ncbi:Ankyrin repeat family protein, putative isoform 2 [Hibiscus syriacus]|uniref:Ankyrin repeat family protein, putative isoform 2 n=1 Tax=Hibiscus syriacus TaxID=106335 RepID=A0A6A2ZD01_HIBSY|nr:Ankyrin repeat family protein, putative isoform 2 [Hibiscus syriacus]